MTPQVKQRIELIRCGNVPEGYKQAGVRIIPCEWDDVKLGDVFEERVEKNCQDLELLSVTGISGVVPRSTIETKDNSSEDKSNYLKICKGDIGYNTMRMWQGVSALSDYEGIVSPAYTILKPSEAISAKYFSYLFKMHDVIFLFYRFSQGIVDDTRSLKYHEFAKLHLKVPKDKKEQEAIAEILSTADCEIELLEKEVEQQKQKKKALMQQLLTGKKRLPGFNSEWDDVKLGDVFEERVEKNCQDLELLSVTGTSGVVPRSTIETKDNSSEDKSNYLKICKGDIGYNTMRMWQGVSALSDYEGIVSPAYTILKPSEAISAKYFSYLFKMHEVIFLFYRFSQGIVDDTRSLKYHEFAKLHLRVPKDKKEQEAIAEILSTVDREIELLEKELEQEKQKKKALMQLLLTGIVRV